MFEDATFADSLSDSPWANRSHRGWTTLASFTVQAAVVGGLLLLPLLYTQGLPHLQAMASLVAPAPPPAPAPPMQARPAAPVTSEILSDGRLMAPHSIPRNIEQVTETVAPPPVDAGTLGVAGGTGDRAAMNGVWNSIGSGLAAVAPPPPPTRPLRRSYMMEGNLIDRVQPVYPPLARTARIQGTVVLRAIISKEGTIENLQVVSGHPMLVPAALAAVRQWRYRPYLLNSEPIEVETQVTVNFILSGE